MAEIALLQASKRCTLRNYGPPRTLSETLNNLLQAYRNGTITQNP